MDALVRRARPGDGEAMSRIFDQAARAASTHFLPARGLAELDTPPERWERDIAAEGVDALVAEHDNQVVAFAVVARHRIPTAIRPTQASWTPSMRCRRSGDSGWAGR